MWAKETVLRDNRQLRREVHRLENENACLKAHIRGLEDGSRTCRMMARAFALGGDR